MHHFANVFKKQIKVCAIFKVIKLQKFVLKYYDNPKLIEQFEDVDINFFNYQKKKCSQYKVAEMKMKEVREINEENLEKRNRSVKR